MLSSQSIHERCHKQKGQALADFARPGFSHRHYYSAGRAGARENPLDMLVERTLSLTLGLLITLAFVLGLQKTLPQREHLPTLLHAFRAQIARVLMPTSPPPALRPSIETDFVKTAEANAEAHMSPRTLLTRWQPFVLEASRRFKLPASWIRAVMQAESGGRTMLNGKPIVSRAGALGLMQLLPDTYNDMRVRYRLGAEITDPHDNIVAGAAYLRALHRRYGFPLMFAAYNAGPRQFERDVQTRHALPAETRAYVRTVIRTVARAHSQDIPSLVPASGGSYEVAGRLLGPPA